MIFPELYSDMGWRNIRCPYCGHTNKLNYYILVSTYDHPEYDDKVLDFRTEEYFCDYCGKRYSLVNENLLYFNRDIGLICYIKPSSMSFSEARDYIQYFRPMSGSSNIYNKRVMLSDYRRDGMNLRVVTSPLELREKILIYRHGLDDKVMEIFKYEQKSVRNMVNSHKSGNNEISAMSFNGIINGNKLSMLINVNGSWDKIAIDAFMYNKVVRDNQGKLSGHDDLCCVDEAWVRTRNR